MLIKSIVISVICIEISNEQPFPRGCT